MKALITDLTRERLAAWFKAHDLPAYRADQVWRWLYVQRVGDWPGMLNVPSGVRQGLAEGFDLSGASVQQVEGQAPGTRKLLVRLRDDECVEAVLIPAGDRRTVCLSTQAGCKYRCAFCASGVAGFRRHLQPGEIVGQVLLAAAEYGDQPTHVVYMGTGEPFDNYEAVLDSVRILNDSLGLNIGARRMTISTCGVVPGIRRLAQEPLQVELSVSLHAPEQTLRNRLMPVNRVYPLAELMQACGEYTEKTGRIITFEYTLVQGLNDSRAHAESLARLVRAVRGRVNLIPLSHVQEFDGRPSPPETFEMFIDVLGREGVNATERVSKGERCRAACGQLRLRTLRERTPRTAQP